MNVNLAATRVFPTTLQTLDAVFVCLQALTRSAKHDGKKEWIERRLKELEERELERRKAESVEIRLPDHPQPATVTNKCVPPTPTPVEIRLPDHPQPATVTNKYQPAPSLCFS